MSSLLAVLIVGTSSLGSHLIYSYPPAPQPVPRTSKPIYSTHSSRAKTHAKSPTYDSGSNDNSDGDSSLPSSDEEDEIELIGQGHHQGRRGSAEPEGGGLLDSFLGFPNATLAGLLSPNRELCDQPFELVVDHLAFVGHPVWLGEDSGQAGVVPEEVEHRGRPGQPQSSAQDLHRTFSQFSLTTSRDNSPAAGSVPPSESGSRPHSPSHNLSSSIDPIASPSSTATLFPGATSMASSHHSHNSVHGSGRLTSFNFVCVIDTPPDSHLSSHLESYYNDVVIPLTANVKALERKAKWLGKEAAKLRRARDKSHDKGLSPAELLAALPSTSPLAAALSHLYNSLKTHHSAQIKLDTVPVQFRLRGEVPLEDNSSFLDALHEDGFRHTKEDDEDEHSRSKSPMGERTGRVRQAPLFSRERRRAKVRFRAWETLLPLEDPEEMIEVVEEGTLLWRFLDICSPTLSFAEYETLLDLEPEDSPLQEIVEHLVHWGKAKVMDVVSLKGNYLVAAAFDGARLAPLTRQFAHEFPRLEPLPVLLASLRPGEPFASLCAVPSLRSTYFAALVWLLRKEVVEKQRTFLRLVASEEVKEAAAMHWSETGGAQGTGSSAPSSSAASDRSGGTRSERSVRKSVEDTKAMSIVGSALSNSPPLSRSASALKFAAASGRKRTSSLNPANAAPKPKLSSANGTYSSASERPEEVTKGPSVILEPGRPSALEGRWIKEMERDKQKSDVDKFERMKKLMNGRSHLDEIRHRAGLTRKELKTVLVAFEECVVAFTHP